MTEYQYSPAVQTAIKQNLRGLFLPTVSLKPATLREDFGGVDLRWMVNLNCPLQVRARFNRPAYASGSDITFRTTEPAMIAAGTYAKLAVFMWFVDERVVCSFLVDVYGMAEALHPPLATRPVVTNGDGTGFHVVELWELVKARAVLRHFGGDHWETFGLGGEVKLNRIIGLL